MFDLFGFDSEYESNDLDEAREDIDKLVKKYAPQIFEKGVDEDLMCNMKFRREVIDKIAYEIAREVARDYTFRADELEPFSELGLVCELNRMVAEAEEKKKEAKEKAQKEVKEKTEKMVKEAKHKLEDAENAAEASEKRRKAMAEMSKPAKTKKTKADDDDYED